MKHKKVLQKIDFIENVTIGLALGLVFSYSFKMNMINGVSIGLSLGFLLQKIKEEKKIVLAIYVLGGLLIGGLVSVIFKFNHQQTVFALSTGMLVGTIVYLLSPNAEKKNINEKNRLLVYIVLIGICLGGILGFICYRLIGMGLGIGLGMILSIFYYLKKATKKQK